MPALTQEELDEFANFDGVGSEHETQRIQSDVRYPVETLEVSEDENRLEMKKETEPNINEIPVAEIDMSTKEEPNEEFVEAVEQPQPSSKEETEGVSDEVEHSSDVTMEDAGDAEGADDDEEVSDTQAESESDHETDETSETVSGGSPETRAESSVEEDNQIVKEDEEGEEEDEDEEEGEEEEDDDNGNDDGEDQKSEETDSSASESASGTDNESESESESEDEEDEDIEERPTSKNCAICRKSLDNAHAEERSECTKCSAQAHKICVQANGVLKEDGSSQWQCQNCLQSENSGSPKDTHKRNRNSAPRLVRDLLPVSRGVQKPNSHSIFAQPLISEGEDGGRALRKRKSPTIEPPVSEKRRRKATPKAISAALLEESKAESVAHATRRASQRSVPTARILQYRPYEKAPPHKFILAFRLDQSKIEKILNKPSRPGRRRADRRRPPKIPPPPVLHPPVPKFPALPTNHLIFPSMWGDRENEANAKPYGGILGESEADTSRSLPQLRDRELFEIARKEAEEERRKTSAAAEAEINGENINTAKPNRTVSGPPSKIKCIQFGKHVIDTFYAAPYPEEYSHESRLFICEFCLKYLPSEFVAYRHKLKCPAKHPPGDEIYRDASISIWEVDGRKKTEYCQCLCLMAKMFLGSKTLYYDVEPFLFYILTEYDEFGYHFVGYFSKEKRPASQNNVSCILVMPIHQRKGYATFLIDFSYLLTRIEGKDGSPEKPLSDMGLTAYRSYWDLTIAKQLLEIGMKPFSTRDLMQRTGMTADDVVHSLERLYAFVKDPVTKTYGIRYDRRLYETIVTDFESKKHRKLKPDNLIWTPYIMGRSDQAHLETQPVQTIAPREGEEGEREEDFDSEQTKSNGDRDPEDAISPKTEQDSSNQAATSSSTKDPLLVNGVGHIAPGPPSAQLLTGLTSAKDGVQAIAEDMQAEPASAQSDEGFTGYALTYRTGNIPPSRFQIDPPIPASMLHIRSHKKRNTGFGRTNTNGQPQSSTVLAPVRSSPRHAVSTNGSVNGSTDTGSPEKPSTPIRRSSRKSGLSNMETVGLDGSLEPDEQEVGDEIEAKVESASGSGSASASESSSGDEEDESVAEDDDDDDDDEEEDEDDEDEDAEIPEDDDEEEEEPDDDPDALDIVDESEEDSDD